MRHLVVIPAAGSGARFYELGKQYPKCLLPYGGKTILSRLLASVRIVYPSCLPIVSVRPEDAENTLWPSNVPLAIIEKTVPQGPATSILYGLEGLNPTQKDCVTVVLSDMVLSEDFPWEEVTNDRVYVHPHTSEQSRWCISQEGSMFIDKPSTPIDGRPLLGVYHFRSATVLLRCLRDLLLLGVGERQISTAMARYLVATGRQRFEETEVELDCVEDLGTLEEYLKRRPGIAPRSFNQISYTPTSVTKSSTQYPEKIRSEALWLSHPPESYRECVPIVRQHGPGEGGYRYTSERIYGHNLRDLALYYDRSPDLWKRILENVWGRVNGCRQSTITSSSEFWKKFELRIRSRVSDVPETYYEQLADATQFFPESGPYHGDLHFSNIIWTGYDLKVIDPRGEYYGHWLYDVAKMCHSALGRYDHLDEGLLGENGLPLDRGYEQIEESFQRYIVSRLSDRETRAMFLITAGLFASLRPLHVPEKSAGFYEEFLIFSKRKQPGVNRAVLKELLSVV